MKLINPFALNVALALAVSISCQVRAQGASQNTGAGFHAYHGKIDSEKVSTEAWAFINTVNYKVLPEGTPDQPIDMTPYPNLTAAAQLDGVPTTNVNKMFNFAMATMLAASLDKVQYLRVTDGNLPMGSIDPQYLNLIPAIKNATAGSYKGTWKAYGANLFGIFAHDGDLALNLSYQGNKPILSIIPFEYHNLDVHKTCKVKAGQLIGFELTNLRDEWVGGTFFHPVMARFIDVDLIFSVDPGNCSSHDTYPVLNRIILPFRVQLPNGQNPAIVDTEVSPLIVLTGLFYSDCGSAYNSENRFDPICIGWGGYGSGPSKNFVGQMKKIQ